MQEANAIPDDVRATVVAAVCKVFKVSSEKVSDDFVLNGRAEEFMRALPPEMRRRVNWKFCDMTLGNLLVQIQGR